MGLDVQDSHSRKILIIQDALKALESDTLPLPEDAAVADGIRGRIYSSYAHTAQSTTQAANALLERERVQQFAEHGRSALDSMRERLASTGRGGPNLANDTEN